jgi:hypothetical protein
MDQISKLIFWADATGGRQTAGGEQNSQAGQRLGRDSAGKNIPSRRHAARDRFSAGTPAP